MRLSLNAYWKIAEDHVRNQTSNKIISFGGQNLRGSTHKHNKIKSNSIAINNFYNLLISRGNKLVKVKFALIQPTSIWTRI